MSNSEDRDKLGNDIAKGIIGAMGVLAAFTIGFRDIWAPACDKPDEIHNAYEFLYDNAYTDNSLRKLDLVYSNGEYAVSEEQIATDIKEEVRKKSEELAYEAIKSLKETEEKTNNGEFDLSWIEKNTIEFFKVEDEMYVKFKTKHRNERDEVEELQLYKVETLENYEYLVEMINAAKTMEASTTTGIKNAAKECAEERKLVSRWNEYLKKEEISPEEYGELVEQTEKRLLELKKIIIKNASINKSLVKDKDKDKIDTEKFELLIQDKNAGYNDIKLERSKKGINIKLDDNIICKIKTNSKSWIKERFEEYEKLEEYYNKREQLVINKEHKGYREKVGMVADRRNGKGR